METKKHSFNETSQKEEEEKEEKEEVEEVEENVSMMEAVQESYQL